MDIGDIGSEVTEITTNAAIAKIRAESRTKKFPITGKCYNCEDESKDRPFCSKECRDDFEEFQRLKNRK